MKIVVLGAKGNLGIQLTKVLKKDHEVFAWDKEDIDISDKQKVFNKIRKVMPDVVINSVAYTAIDESEDNENYNLAKNINGDIVGYLSDICLDLNLLFVHYSTNHIFSGEKKDGYLENDESGPVNKYGETKLIGEKEILKRAEKGLKWYLIRTSHLFGMTGESELSKPSFFNLILSQYGKATAENKKSLKVVNEGLSNFTYTYDLSLATKEMVESNKKIEYGIYHISNSEPVSWYDAAVELFKISEIDFKIEPITRNEYDSSAKRPKYGVLLNTKLPKLRNWKEALREYVKGP